MAINCYRRLAIAPIWFLQFLFIVIAVGLSSPASIRAQSVDDYRSLQTGNWTSSSSWERYDGVAWIPAGSGPTQNNGVITVRSGHTLTVGPASATTNLRLDEVIIETGATFELLRRVRISDGPGLDLQCDGTIRASRNFLLVQSSSATFGPTAYVEILAEDFRVDGSSTATFATNSELTIGPAGDLLIRGTSVFSAQTGVTITNRGRIRARNSAQMNLSGVLINEGLMDFRNSSSLRVEGGGIYEHAQDGGTLSSASRTVWMAGSTMIFSGIVSSMPVQLAQSFHDVIWDSPAQSADVSFAGQPLLIDGQLEIRSSGTGTVSWVLNETADLNIGARFIQTGGIFRLVGGTGTSTMRVTGDLIQMAGTIDVHAAASPTVIEIGGELDLFGDMYNQHTFLFNGGVDQRIQAGASELRVQELLIDNPTGTIYLDSAIRVDATAAVRNGNLDVNGQSLSFSPGATLFSSGNVIGDVQFERFFGLNSNGWRMIASPLDGVVFSSLNPPFHTQGAPWADLSFGYTNLQSLNFALQDWSPNAGLDDIFATGEGYIFYMYDQDPDSNPVLPAIWRVSGSIRPSAVLPLNFNSSSTNSYNFVGNSTTGNLDWDEVVATSVNVASTYATWDPALTDAGGLTGYKYYNSASSIGSAGRFIPPFSAFMVEPTAAGGLMTFPESESANRQSANYFGKSRQISSHVQLVLEGQGLAEQETYLTFDSGATNGKDAFDSTRLLPISPDFATMWSNVDGHQFAFDGRPTEALSEQFDFSVAATRPGTYSLSWPKWHDIPDQWELILMDQESGEVRDMREYTNYQFVVGEDQIVTAEKGKELFNSIPVRLSLIVRTQPGSFETEAAAALQDHVVPGSMPALTPNYPNPFRDRTRFRMLVPEPGHVTIEVFDTLGRRVDIVFDGPAEKGWHELEWLPKFISSGIYYYKLRIGSFSVNRSLIKID